MTIERIGQEFWDKIKISTEEEFHMVLSKLLNLVALLGDSSLSE